MEFFLFWIVLNLFACITVKTVSSQIIIRVFFVRFVFIGTFSCMNNCSCVYRSSPRIIEICPLNAMKTGKTLFRVKYDVLVLSAEDAEEKATQENHVRDW